MIIHQFPNFGSHNCSQHFGCRPQEQLGVDSITCTSGCSKLCREKALTWTQDGMDQSKFRCPRNSVSKSLTDCWRPQKGIQGVCSTMLSTGGKYDNYHLHDHQYNRKLVYRFLRTRGHVRWSWEISTCDQDLGKGSDVQCTATSRALEVGLHLHWSFSPTCSNRFLQNKLTFLEVFQFSPTCSVPKKKCFPSPWLRPRWAQVVA